MVRKWNLLNLWFVCESAWQGVRDFHIYFYRLLCQIIHSFKHFIIIVLNRRYVGKCKYFYTNFVIFFSALLRQTCDNATESDQHFFSSVFRSVLPNVLRKQNVAMFGLVAAKCCIIFHFYGIECVWCCHLFTFNFLFAENE